MKIPADKLPLFKRARDYHLYDYRGKRYLDLYQDNGRAILGHRPPGVQAELKRLLDKGLAAELPSVYGGRLEKALPKLLKSGTWTARVFPSRLKAVEAAAAFLEISPADLKPEDPALTLDGPSPAGLFRPFLEADYASRDVLFPVLPFPGAFAPCPVLFRSPGLRDLPPADPSSPLLAAGLLEALQRLLKIGESPDIWKDWKLSGWKRQGCYCIAAEKPERYEEDFLRFLEAGILLPPDSAFPIILPREFSDGERKLVERLCGEAAGA